MCECVPQGSASCNSCSTVCCFLSDRGNAACTLQHYLAAEILLLTVTIEALASTTRADR